MRLNPIGNRLMVDAQRPSNAPIIQPLYIMLKGLLVQLRSVTVFLWRWRVFAATRLAQIALAARPIKADFDLLCFALTRWTLYQPTILPVPAVFATPRRVVPCPQLEYTRAN